MISLFHSCFAPINPLVPTVPPTLSGLLVDSCVNPAGVL